MNSARRAFLKSVGIGLASLVMAQCAGFGDGSDPTEPATLSPLDHLRKSWLGLGNLAEITSQDFEQGEQLMGNLLKDHRTALDELAANSELDAAVADQIQIAFSEAAYHMWRSNAPITCYEPMIVDYAPTSRGQLIQQTSLLATLADSGSFDENTIAQAQAALERDIAFLNFTDAETQTLYQRLGYAAGETFNYPSFNELDLEISSAAIEAAKYLVRVMLEHE